MEKKRPTGIKLKSGRTLAVDGVFVAYGSVPQSELIRIWCSLMREDM